MSSSCLDIDLRGRSCFCKDRRRVTGVLCRVGFPVRGGPHARALQPRADPCVAPAPSTASRCTATSPTTPHIPLGSCPT